MKKKSPVKAKFSLTLNGWDAAVLDEALQTLLNTKCPLVRALALDKLDQSEGQRALRKWLVEWAIRTVSTAVIQKGGMFLPFGVELKPESPAVQQLRIAYLEGPTGLQAVTGIEEEEPQTFKHSRRFSFPE